MKKSLSLGLTVLISLLVSFLVAAADKNPNVVKGGTTVFINEIHYDNSGTDTGEAIEVAGPAGTNLSGWSLVLYNGANGLSYNTTALSGTIPDQQAGLGTLSFSYPTDGIQNGSPDGIALVNGTTVVQFLSYEGTFTAMNGPANMMTSVDIGVSETGSTPVGHSLRLSGTGCTYEEFTWNGAAASSFGAVNTDQTGNCTGGQPLLSINNVSVLEGDSGTTTASFTVSLSSVAGMGGVTFNIATQDNSATVANNDYVARTETAQTIPEGSQNYSFNVTINGDTGSEPNETFFVNVTNVTGATLADGQGVGTITNDDFAAIPISTVQGSGSASPFAGTVVTVTGIVTGLKSNGFFMQTPDGQVDGNPATSEGIFVFTSSPLPAGAAIGNSVAVTGTVTEFVPSQDPNSPPITEMSNSPSVILLSTGNPLPIPVTLTTAHTNPSGSIEQLEKFECMRVFVSSLTATSPTDGFTNEPNATGSSDGTFYAVITGIARPFREPGIEVPFPLPEGSPCCVPRFDANPERLRVDSDAQPGAIAINVTTGAIITNVTGPLDYAFRTYTILPDAATPPGVSGIISAMPVPVPAADEFTVGSFNMERFYDTSDGPGGDVVLTTTAYNNRLNKASLAIRNVMRTPDIIGIEEMENLTTLQDVANKVNNDAVAAGDPNPMYTAHLVEGNDVGGIDVGFLVKTSRVAVLSVVQEGKNATYTEPGGGTALLNDRPSLVLIANITAPCGGVFPITVIVNHLRSLNGVDDPADGARVRAKRRAQAEFLANLIQARMTANPNEKIISVGDYNAFQFNDGYVDMIGTIKGVPTPANQVVLASGDLVNPDLIDLVEQAPADQRYSFTFDGNAQTLDHELITPNLLPNFSRIHYARSNGDFPEVYRSDANRPERLSDHDMPVAYFKFAGVSKKSDFYVFTGGSGSVDVMAPAGCNWTAVSNDTWIELTSSGIGSGNDTVTYLVRENFTGVPRIGTLTVAGHTLIVTQDSEASLNCTYVISPKSGSFVPAGGTGIINVTTEARCLWQAASNNSWITIEAGSLGTGNGIVIYRVASNAGPGGRSGIITVAGKTFTVKQK